MITNNLFRASENPRLQTGDEKESAKRRKRESRPSGRGNLLTQLKETGYKLTSARVEILKILSSTNPLSAQEVFEILKMKGLNTDLVTSYRTLELFNDLGFVQKIQFEDNVARYELIEKQSHHHHLVCIKCGKREDIALDELPFIRQIQKQSAFKVQRHALEFFGFCEKCQH